MTSFQNSPLLFYSHGDLPPLPSNIVSHLTLRCSGVKQLSSFNTKMFLALSSQHSLFVFGQTVGIAMEHQELKYIAILGIHSRTDPLTWTRATGWFEWRTRASTNNTHAQFIMNGDHSHVSTCHSL